MKAVERKKKKTAKVFGIPSEAQWKKGNLPLASTSETLRSCATLDAGFPFSMELGRTASRQGSQELERFLLFSLPHKSPVNETKKESAVSARRS